MKKFFKLGLMVLCLFPTGILAEPHPADPTMKKPGYVLHQMAVDGIIGTSGLGLHAYAKVVLHQENLRGLNAWKHAKGHQLLKVCGPIVTAVMATDFVLRMGDLLIHPEMKSAESLIPIYGVFRPYLKKEDKDKKANSDAEKIKAQLFAGEASH